MSSISSPRKKLSPIQEFYAGSSIFITGGTGFLGTILIEKLLRSCDDIACIYLLARSKKGKDVQNRIDELFDNDIFSRLREEVPKFRHKVIAIDGDISLPDLGISTQDKQMLINEVSIIFHCAATVRFDEKLKTAVAINIKASEYMLSLAKEMSHLKSYVHVSTAYSYVPHKIIEEKFYPSPVDGKKMILLADTLPENILDKITPIILDKWPNTYTFTKAIAEDIVSQDGKMLPVAIFRPSIVISTYQEPFEAWINNMYGPTGVCAGAGSGLLRALHADSKVNANVVPVDMCVNGLIALAWDTANHFKQDQSNIPICLYESSNDRPINWGTFMELSRIHGLSVPSNQCIWYYCFDLYRFYFVYSIVIFFLHYVPAAFVDLFLICTGKSPKMLRIYKKVHKFTGVISYFSTRTWIFRSKRMNQIIERMDETDRTIFFCDLNQLDWHRFFRTYLRGIRVYLLRDPLDTLEVARVRWKRFYWLHNTIKYLLFFLILRVLWWGYSLVFS